MNIEQIPLARKCEEQFVKRGQNIDIRLTIEALKAGKTIESLEKDEDRDGLKRSMKKELDKSTMQWLEISDEELDKCDENQHQSFIKGSEELCKWETEHCQPGAMKILTERRNYNMAAKADHLLRQSGISFFALGRFHIPGDEGFCNLLRQREWSIQQISEI